MLPRLGSSKLITLWLAITITASTIGFLDGGWLAGWCALEPRRIWHGEIWRLATWPLVELGLISLVVSCMAIFGLGSELAGRWGDRRLHTYMAVVLVASGVAFSLASVATGDASLWHCGGLAAASALVIAWARAFPERTLVLW